MIQRNELEIVQDYINETDFKELLIKHKLSARTLYRILKKNNIDSCRKCNEQY